MRYKNVFRLSAIACSVLLLGAQAPSALAVNDQPFSNLPLV